MPEELKNWLAGCPELSALATDIAACGAPGLFPMEKETLWRKEDVLGGETVRHRIRFAIRGIFTDTRDTAALWLGDVQQWLLTHKPGFGTEEEVRIYKAGFQGEKGGLIEYTVTAAVDFTCRP